MNHRMYCYRCNRPVTIVADGWICFVCGENGPTPVRPIPPSDIAIEVATLTRSPLSEPCNHGTTPE